MSFAGTRIIPPGAITGAQFIQTPEYVSVVGMIQQTAVNIAADDAGGEMDSGVFTNTFVARIVLTLRSSWC